MDNPEYINHHDILKWAEEVLDLIAKHTDSHTVIGKVLETANGARYGRLDNLPISNLNSSECHEDQQE